MNLLEHYIIKVISVVALQAPSSLEDSYIEVEVLCDCYGDRRVVKHVTTRDIWIREMKQGYFWA